MLWSVYLLANLEGQLEITGLHSKRELLLRTFRQLNRSRCVSLAHQVSYQVFLLFAQFGLHHLLHTRPILFLHGQLELDVFVLRTLNLKNLASCVESKELSVCQFSHQMQRLIESLQHSGFTIDESIFPVVFSCVEEKIFPLPESRLD